MTLQRGHSVPGAPRPPALAPRGSRPRAKRACVSDDPHCRHTWQEPLCLLPLDMRKLRCEGREPRPQAGSPGDGLTEGPTLGRAQSPRGPGRPARHHRLPGPSEALASSVCASEAHDDWALGPSLGATSAPSCWACRRLAHPTRSGLSQLPSQVPKHGPPTTHRCVPGCTHSHTPVHRHVCTHVNIQGHMPVHHHTCTHVHTQHHCMASRGRSLKDEDPLEPTGSTLKGSALHPWWS